MRRNTIIAVTLRSPLVQIIVFLFFSRKKKTNHGRIIKITIISTITATMIV